MTDHFIDSFHWNDLQTVAYFFRNILQIPDIGFRDQNFFDARALGSHEFLRKTADGHDLSAQGHFAGHGELIAHGNSSDERDQCRQQSDTCRGAVFRNGSGRNVNMDIRVFEIQLVVQENGFYQTDGDGSRFLHDIAQLSGEDHLAASVHGTGLNEQDLAANLSPGKPRGDAGRTVFQFSVVLDSLVAKIFGNFFCCNGDAVLLAVLHIVSSGMSAEDVQLLFQSADTGLHSVFLHDALDGTVRDMNLSLIESGILHGPGEEMTFCDLHLIQRRITGKSDHFHTVQKRSRNGIPAVCRADKQHIGKIIGDVHVMIRKGVVLFRIQYFKKSTCGISLIAALNEFVHLVQDHDGVHGTGTPDAVHNTSGHGADISAAMAADLGLITDAAKADAHIFASQGFRNAPPHAGLAGAGGTYQKENGAGLIFLEGHYRQLLNDAVLYLGQTVMIPIQDLSCLFEVHRFGLVRDPLEGSDKIQVIFQCALFRIVWLRGKVPFQYTVHFLAGLFRHAGFFHFPFEFIFLRSSLRIHIVQLLLQKLKLLLNGGFLVGNSFGIIIPLLQILTQFNGTAHLLQSFLRHESALFQ